MPTDIEKASLAGSSDCLDPRIDSSEMRHSLDRWLDLQEALCLRPEIASVWLQDCGGDPGRVLARVRDRRSLPSAELARRRLQLADLGVVALPQPSARYPERLRPIPDPPPLLLVRGDVDALRRPMVAIVGARAATAYGLGLARELAAGLARLGAVVVSGLARGIDAAAHAGALEAGGTTVAVQACGPDIVYPPEHRRLAERIVQSGAVVTELPPGRPPLAAHFPLRNRLISGLALGVVVVEARPRSGSLITARHALDQGREVLAVPGPVTAATSAGPNALLRDGARPVIELRDVVEALGLEANSPSPAARAPTAPHSLDLEDARVLTVLRAGARTHEELGAELGWSARELAVRLLGLELEGLVVADRDGRLRAVPRGVF